MDTVGVYMDQKTIKFRTYFTAISMKQKYGQKHIAHPGRIYYWKSGATLIRDEDITFATAMMKEGAARRDGNRNVINDIYTVLSKFISLEMLKPHLNEAGF